MELHKLIKTLIAAFFNGNKLLICGNGGSSAEADHLAAELVGKYMHDDRPALPAMSLATSAAIVTSLGNDKGYDQVFARQVEAYGQKGDVLIILTTSDADDGHSTNLLEALKVAVKKDMITAGFVSKERTHKLLEWLDYAILAEGSETSTIQENQLKMIHTLSEYVEKAFV